ncbi:hypothetical protein JX265_003133 [Neoarthrinium moseri]|uniref:Ankyrin repeat protein n=1 Tax=Neoarthrinium moseri TaxID=1658444 RepID=A0A9P9WU59_9PEZI|nr:hypothetical protein JX265_003133 [Neoarthrinium moseri]
MEPLTGKRARDESTLYHASSVSDSKRAKPLSQKEMRDRERRRIEALYADLPVLPPKLPAPDYLVDGQITYSKDNASLEFYAACVHGDLDKVRSYTESSSRPQADLQYGLEKAAHGFHVEVVCHFMREQSTKLHTRVFETEDKTHSQGLNIFLYGSPKLFELLRELLDNGWHPNQVLGTAPQKVALHYPCCIKDLSILQLLLQHGADPSISRHPYPSPAFLHFPHEAPLARKCGEVLNMAASTGSTEAIDLLLSYGAKLEYGSPLHRLAGYSYAADDSGQASRYAMADHLINVGDDINGLRNVGDVVKPYSIIPFGGSFQTTPLSHATALGDWAFVEWLLEKGADPEAAGGRAFSTKDVLYYGRPERTAEEYKGRLLKLIDKTQNKGQTVQSG